MLISMLILAFAAVLLFASDHLAHARLQRPHLDGAGPASSTVARWENVGGRMLGATTDSGPGPSMVPTPARAGCDAAGKPAGHP